MDLSPREWGGIFAAVGFFGPLWWWSEQRQRKLKQEWRQWAEQQYAAVKIASSNPSLAFDANAAEIVKDEEEVLIRDGRVVYYALVRIARNPFGEYFWFRMDPGAEPNLMFRHMSEVVAHTVLQEKYQPRKRKRLSLIGKRS
jgi:hypothetical protein